MRSWLKNAREERGETMKTLAEKLGISESYYCSIENGVRQKRMDVSLASKLSVALGMPIVDIIANEKNGSDEVISEGAMCGEAENDDLQKMWSGESG